MRRWFDVTLVVADAQLPVRKKAERQLPQLGPVRDFIDRILEVDQQAPRKQRHTAHRIYERIRREKPEAEQRNSEGAEEMCTDRQIPNAQVLARRRTITLDGEVLRRIVATDWRKACECCDLHTWSWSKRSVISR